MKDYVELYDIAKLRSDISKEDALWYAEQIIKEPSRCHLKKFFLESLDMSRRWDWLRTVSLSKMTMSTEDYKEHKEEYINIFRVRPQ